MNLWKSLEWSTLEKYDFANLVTRFTFNLAKFSLNIRYLVHKSHFISNIFWSVEMYMWKLQVFLYMYAGQSNLRYWYLMLWGSHPSWHAITFYNFFFYSYTVKPLFKKFTQRSVTYEPTNCCVRKLHKLCKILHKLCNFLTQQLVGSYVTLHCVNF